MKKGEDHEAGLPDNSPFEDGYRLGTFRGAFALFCLYRPAALSPTPQLSLAYTNDCSVAGSIRRTRGPHCYSMFRLSKRKKELSGNEQAIALQLPLLFFIGFSDTICSKLSIFHICTCKICIVKIGTC